MGNQFNSYVWNDGSKTADYWQQLSDFNKWGSYSPAFGFMWDSTDYSTNLTALNNALNTYMPALETGSVGVDGVDSTLQQLNDALYAAGLQDVIDEKQRQLDEWLAENGATQTPEENQELIDSVSSGSSNTSADETSAETGSDASADTSASTTDTTAESAAETTTETE